jgi:crotonobetaine/carnitine-CoA ligase
VIAPAGGDRKPVAWDGHLAEPWSAVPRRPVLELLGPALAWNHHPVVLFDDGASFTGAELHDRIERFAGVLATCVAAGDRVLLACGNRAEFLIAYFGVIASRCTAVPVSPGLGGHDMAHAVNGARCVVAVAEAEAAGTIDGVRDRCPGLRTILRIEGPEPGGLSHLEQDGSRLQLADVRADPGDLVDIGFTSGTTGLPKALGGDHAELLRYVDVSLRASPPSPDERTMLGTPFHYGDALYNTVAAALSRTSVVVMRRFSVSRFWETARRFGATRIATIGSIPSLLLTAPPSPGDRDHAVRYAIAIGIPKDAHAVLEERFGFPWYEAYGSSESGPAIAMPPSAAPQYVGTGALGVPYPDVQARLVDPDGRVLDGPATGELELSGAIIFSGYLNNPDATAEVLHDGWLRTGDIMRRDQHGVFYFLGRRKEIIRRGGENVAPAEVEEVLRLHEAVIDAAVVAVADPLQGEEIKAYVQVRPDAEIEPGTITDFCADHLARFKVPRYVELRTDPFPRTPSQRIRKDTLKVDGQHLVDGAWDRIAGG